ncbi:hypothetical protein FA95DRAFT_1536210 [Auriscalpium vulgare]|uniref:Uncharacterized protein n=1 Tax=Auriscalpium vulgare TaxID=40419 RepID=A0ACB8S3I1_9AGAM|nr:hypothetical protein FA95DRAFT_1536210 [Auriscalpium vulgare]
MSSKRGRKRNDNLPPNRARDVQRAFRARRAAHLEALEQRVSELEEENSTLRAALSLPPANRPALGKGPTGKDKPKPGAPPTPTSSRGPGMASGSLETFSRESSSADSPSSTRAHSLSPTTITAPMRPSPHSAHSLEGGAGGTWDQPMLMGEDDPQPALHASPPSVGYPLSSAAATHKPAYSSYPGPVASSSRSALPGSMYMPSVPQGAQNYAGPPDRPMPDAYAAGGGYPLRDPREEQSQPQQQHFSYPAQAAFTSPDPSHMHQHSPQAQQMQMHHSQRQTPQPQPYPHRRSITEPDLPFRSSMTGQYPGHLPPPQPPPSMRRQSPPRPPDNAPSLRPFGGQGGS